MDPHLISATLSAEDQQAINAAIDTLRQKLPFLIDLTIAQRREMPKAADKTKAFVQKAVEVANEHSPMFPAAFLEELRKDWQLLGSLSPITLAIQTLAKKLDDTTLQLGGETFAAARTIYSTTKTPSANAALRKAANDLAKRWGRRKKVDDTTPTAPPPSPTTTAHS